jgi:translation initiation factor 3 subunit C
MDALLNILEATPTLTIRITTDDTEDAILEQNFKNGENVIVNGTLAALVDRLDDEFVRSLQNIDPHTSEYVERLRDENKVYALIVRVQNYFVKLLEGGLEDGKTEVEEMAAVAIGRRLEHLYYKTDALISATEGAIRADPALAKLKKVENDVLVSNLTKMVYKYGSERLRSRALLAHVYYLALHDQFHAARDMLLMSHLQENISHADIPTQILYNRAMVQIGLCAFRLGMIREAHGALSEIMQSGRQKELLAQGHQQRVRDERAIEQERLEKLRQLPFHMHINVELLEAVYLVCSMLMEVPNMAANKHDTSKKVISRNFRKMLGYSERQVFTGPPENTRDHIMAASKSLSMGEWQKARDFICAIKVWDLMPDAAKIRHMLTGKIQEEGLKTYLFSYGSHYDTLKLSQLASMFDLQEKQVHVLVCKMVAMDEISATLDEGKGLVLMQSGAEQTRLQYLAAAYGEKVNQLVETNEKQLDLMTQMLGMAQVQQPKRDDRKGPKRNQPANTKPRR